MSELVPPSRAAMAESMQLSGEILKNIELSEISLSSVALKTSRLARLLNDFDHQKIFEYEAAGYPSGPAGVQPEVWALLKLAGRTYQVVEKDKTIERAYVESIAALESRVELGETALGAAKDPNVSISSANPHQIVGHGIGNRVERNQIRSSVSTASSQLSARRGLLHAYVNRRFYELKFSGIADDIFSRIRERVDQNISAIVPASVQKLSSIYENLSSENPEDWSNAVHGCRRLLQDLADAVFPKTDDKIIEVNGKEKIIKLGADNYVNRLIAFIESKSDSERYLSIVGSGLNFIGDRLDSVFKAAQKGSHSTIQDRAEADRYVIYTYMIVGDIIALNAN